MSEKLKDFVARKFQIDLKTAEKEIKNGMILVNDKPFTNPEHEIKPEAEEKITHKERHIYSVSQLKKYMTCPESYRLAYIEGLESKQTFIGTITGKVFHKCMEYKVSSSDLQTIIAYFNEELAEMKEAGVEFSLPPKGRKNAKLTDKEWENHLIEQSVLEVQKFLEAIETLGLEITENEKEVNFKIDNYPFVGYIDFVADTFFGDFKTTYSENYFNPDDHKLQLALYSYALGMREAILVVFFRNGNTTMKVYKYSFSEAQIEEYVNLAKKICFAIDNKVFWKKSAKWIFDWRTKKQCLSEQWCDRVCPYKIHCFGEPPEKEN